VKVDGVRRVVVRQAQDLESMYYTIKQVLNDPETRGTILVPIGILVLIYPLALLGDLLNLPGSMLGLSSALLGLYLISRGLGLSERIDAAVDRARRGLYAGRMTLISYVVAAALTENKLAPLVPESGMAVAGATPHAERPDEVAAVDGRITLTMAGPQPNHGVRFGSEPELARSLLAVREHDPSRQFGVTCRLSDDAESAVGTLDGPVATVADGEREAAATPEALVERAFERTDGAATVTERVETVLSAVQQP